MRLCHTCAYECSESLGGRAHGGTDQSATGRFTALPSVGDEDGQLPRISRPPPPYTHTCVTLSINIRMYYFLALFYLFGRKNVHACTADTPTADASTNRCGTSWSDAKTKCLKCPGGVESECPAGQGCYAGHADCAGLRLCLLEPGCSRHDTKGLPLHLALWSAQVRSAYSPRRNLVLGTGRRIQGLYIFAHLSLIHISEPTRPY